MVLIRYFSKQEKLFSVEKSLLAHKRLKRNLFREVEMEEGNVNEEEVNERKRGVFLPFFFLFFSPPTPARMHACMIHASPVTQTLFIF